MAYGIQVFDASGALSWDSTTVVGGVVADYREYLAGTSGVLLYPDFAGRTVFLIPVLDSTTATVTVDTGLGYPRVTIVTATFARRFMLVVF